MTKSQILLDLANSRTALVRNYGSVRRELDVPAKIDNLVRRKPMAWLGGAAALGWILSGPKTRTRVVTKTLNPAGKQIKSESKRTASRFGFVGIIIALFKLALPLLQPALTAYAGKRFAEATARLPK